MDTITTPRLTLRGWDVRDARDVFAYAQSPVVGPAAGWRPHASLRESEDVIRMFIHQNDCWAITLKSGGKVIGSIGLHQDRYRPEINARMMGYVLSHDYWGHGLATEAAKAAVQHAFDVMAVDILSINHYPHNTRSRRVIEKCGFAYDGRLRQACKIYNGKIYDAVCYSMTREEYDALPQYK